MFKKCGKVRLVFDGSCDSEKFNMTTPAGGLYICKGTGAGYLQGTQGIHKLGTQ